MSALKLFISHSSRLDDMPAETHPEKDPWELLDECCSAVRSKYGNLVEILVDNQGLRPAEDWNRELNVWLAECHVAIILFSRRAIEKSEWVRKEAAVLAWRSSLDPKFKLIPVCLKNQSTPDALASEFWSVLEIDRNQCIRDAETAQDVLDGVIKSLGEPENLAIEHAATPLDLLAGGIAKTLHDETTPDSMSTTLNDLNCAPAPDGAPCSAVHYATALARHLIRGDPAGPVNCFHTFMHVLNGLQPKPTRERSESLLKSIRALWIDAGAAARFARARMTHRPLVVNGRYIARAQFKADCYTLERFLERARPGSNLFKYVSLSGHEQVEEIRAEIRRRILGDDLPDDITPQEMDAEINNDPRTIVLLLPATADDGGLPGAQIRSDLENIVSDYGNLIAIVHSGDVIPSTIPDNFDRIDPELDLHMERTALMRERQAIDFLAGVYK